MFNNVKLYYEIKFRDYDKWIELALDLVFTTFFRDIDGHL